MKNVLILAIALVSSAAFARPDTTKMSCAAAKALVDTNGSIVLSTGASLYDRYVSGNSFAGSNETTVPSYVPTMDNAECFIGYVVRTGNASDNAGSNIVKPIRKPIEGAVQYFPDSVYNSSGKLVGAWFKVVNGKWVEMYPSGATAPAAKKCVEGSFSTGWESKEGNHGSYNVPYQAVCKNGRWVKAQ